MGVAIPITILAGLGLVYWWATVRDKQRREKLVELASSLGLEIVWELSPQDNKRFQRFDIASKGRSQAIPMALCADTGQTRMVVFDYRYVTGHGKNRVDRFFSMVLCTDSRLRAPKLALQPETWSSKIVSWMGVSDIDFNDDPEFSAAFHLSGAEEADVRQFMNPARRQALLAHPTIRLEVAGDSILIMKPHFKLDADRVRNYMSEALAAIEIMIDPFSEGA